MKPPQTRFPQTCKRRWKSSRKRCYGTIEDAEAALKATKADCPGKEFNLFLCRSCGAWHIGGARESA